jgi:hypothetical protein
MRRRSLPLSVVLIFVVAALTAAGGDSQSSQTERAGITTDAPADAMPSGEGAKVYEGRIKDVRPVWGLLVLTVGQGKQARDMRFDMGEARIVGPSGDEWKGQDLRIRDRVRVAMTPDGTLVQQISVLPDRAGGVNE